MLATPIPNVFFSEVLPQIDSQLELKVSLQAFRLFATKRGYPRYLTESEMLGDAAVVAGLGTIGEAAPALAEGLRLAVERGTLLRLDVERGGRAEALYFLNGPDGRRAIESIRSGGLSVGQTVAAPEAVTERGERASIYTLYEQNIGVLTPLIAEELAEAERLYPSEWLESAVRQAVGYNRRSWKYVQRILETWAVEGRRDDKGGRGAGQAAEAARGQRGGSGWGTRRG